MTNVEQGMSKEEVLHTSVLPLLTWTFLVRYWTFFSLRGSVVLLKQLLFDTLLAGMSVLRLDGHAHAAFGQILERPRRRLFYGRER